VITHDRQQPLASRFVEVRTPPKPLAARRDDPEEVVGHLASEYSGLMLGYARSLCRDEHIAQDLVQEALVRAWRHAGVLEESRGSVKGWLFTVLRNLEIDRRRARSSRPITESLEGVPEPRDWADDARYVMVEDRMLVEELLNRLPAGERTVIVALYLRDLTVVQAAEALGLPLGTVKSRSLYGMRRLRQLATSLLHQEPAYLDG
jgi:RNA polymerase sigma-70 factor (ECF subfamily)